MFDYQMFAEDTGTNLNTTATMPDEIKTYYDDYLIDCSLPKLVHDQFGQKRPIPAGRGKTIEFRKVSPLPVSTTPLTEGVTPEGQKLTISGIDKEMVGEMAARIRRIRKPEPYKGKGIKYENEVIRRKAGKSGAKGK